MNQFRLYGKEDGVEASGCCLVFNNNNSLLNYSDFSVSYGSLMLTTANDSEQTDSDIQDNSSEDSPNKNLPLYQVAYIAYKDNYISENKCAFWLPDNQGQPKFGIRLKKIGDNDEWHQFRIAKLEQAFQDLITACRETEIGNAEKQALECIRYLFKDFAFRDEEEFRLLKIEKIDSDKIQYCDQTDSLCLEYMDISTKVDEVILGTNYEKTNRKRKAEVFQYKLRRKHPEIAVSHSSLPINANEPIKK